MQLIRSMSRAFGAGLVCFGVLIASGAPAEMINCDPAEIGFAESTMGISYQGYGAPLREILSKGEQERLSTIQPYDTLDANQRRAVRTEWGDLLKALFDGTLAPTFTGGGEPDFDLLRAAAPVMLARLKQCGPAADKRLSYLDDIPLEIAPVPGGSE